MDVVAGGEAFGDLRWVDRKRKQRMCCVIYGRGMKKAGGSAGGGEWLEWMCGWGVTCGKCGTDRAGVTFEGGSLVWRCRLKLDPPRWNVVRLVKARRFTNHCRSPPSSRILIRMVVEGMARDVG